MNPVVSDEKVIEDILSFAEHNYDKLTDVMDSLITSFNEAYTGNEYQTSVIQASLIGCLYRNFLFDALSLQSKYFDKEECLACVKQTIKESINEIVEEFFHVMDRVEEKDDE